MSLWILGPASPATAHAANFAPAKNQVLSCFANRGKGASAPQVKSLSMENGGMQARMQAALEEQRRRALEAVRSAEGSRARMLCEKAAAEHDLAQVRLHCSAHVHAPMLRQSCLLFV